MTWWLPSPSDDSPFIRVWTGGIKTEGGLGIAAATRNVAQTSQAGDSLLPSTMLCTTPCVTHTNMSISTVDILKTDINNQFISMINSTVTGSVSQEYQQDYVVMQYDAVIVAFANAVVGTVDYRPDLQVFSDDDNLNYDIAYSPPFRGISG